MWSRAATESLTKHSICDLNSKAIFPMNSRDAQLIATQRPDRGIPEAI